VAFLVALTSVGMTAPAFVVLALADLVTKLARGRT
jgi:hypothetical protein